jgi:hypothetical protein
MRDKRKIEYSCVSGRLLFALNTEKRSATGKLLESSITLSYIKYLY